MNKHSLSINFCTNTAHNGELYAIDVTYIAYTEGEISRIMWRGVFCVHIPYSLMPGHIFTLEVAEEF